MKTLFASDFDGTLSWNGGIAPETLRAIAAYRAKGGVFGICTGRDPGSLKSELTACALHCDFLILMNGARIECEGVCVREHVLTGFEIALPLLREKTLFFSMIGDGERYLHPSEVQMEKPAEQTYLAQMRAQYRQMPAPEALRVVYQISCRTQSAAAAVELTQSLRALGLAAFANWEYVDIVPPGVSKAEAVAFVAARLGVAEPCVYTAGDGRNDMGMLARYHGFAMDIAEPCVKDAASCTVRSVAQALDQLGKEPTHEGC